MAVSVANVGLMERLCHLTNKIYRKILCLSRQSSHEKMVITTIHGLDDWNVLVSSSSPQHRIELSWDLLAWIAVEGRVLCSFTDFITTPELSGPLYIRPGVYYSQITEYILQKIKK